MFNNGIMAIETPSLVHAQQEYGANNQGGNYAQLAEALGAWGKRVTRAGGVPARARSGDRRDDAR